MAKSFDHFDNEIEEREKDGDVSGHQIADALIRNHGRPLVQIPDHVTEKTRR